MDTAAASRQVLSLQVLRAVAALMVVGLHLMHEAGALAARGGVAFPEPFPVLNSGVDLFFVISGFVMVFASGRWFQQPGAAATFFSRRVARIVPSYWIATTLYLAVWGFGSRWVNRETVTPGDVVMSYGFIPFGAYLQPVYTLGWTLNFEMFFYLCFAGVIFLPRFWAVLCLTLGFLVLVALGRALHPVAAVPRAWSQPIVLEFVVGAWIGLGYVRGVRIPRLAGYGLVAAAWAMALSRFGFESDGWLGRALYWGAPAALVVAGCTLGRFAFAARWMSPLIGLGNASYALYLWHPFALRLTAKLWERAHLVTPLGIGCYCAASLVAALIVAAAVYIWLERPLTRIAQGQLDRLQRQHS